RLVARLDRFARDDLRGIADVTRARQIDFDRRAVFFLTVNLDVSTRLLDEAVDHAQPEAGSLAHLLGREERLEHLVANRRRDALAGVLHGDHHITSGLNL